MTPARRTILDFIGGFLAANNRRPTENEVRAKYGWHRPLDGRAHLRSLIARGFVERSERLCSRPAQRAPRVATPNVTFFPVVACLRCRREIVAVDDECPVCRAYPVRGAA